MRGFTDEARAIERQTVGLKWTGQDKGTNSWEGSE